MGIGNDDWEYSDDECPKCQSQLATRTCGSCGGEGWIDDDEEDTDVGFGSERCDQCNGEGHETWCRECGWDMNFKCFFNPELEAAWKAKQSSPQEGATVNLPK